MATENQVREALIEAFTILREQQNSLHSLIVEISAVRESLNRLSEGQYDAILCQHRAQHRAETEQSAYADLRRFDERIERLKRLP
jgi:hypothetical protein